MDIFNLIKIITTLITSGVSLAVGTRILILNRTDWLNRWFTLFLYSSASGFLIYALYHLILDNPAVIVPMMITSHIFFNFLMVSLTMTVFVLEKYTKVAMSLTYLGTMLVVFFIMSLGYFIFVPTLDMNRYAAGIVDTSTPLGWLITVNVIRVGLGIYVIWRYIIMERKIESETRNRIKWFSYGVIMAVLGMIINLAGGALSSILIEIIALIFVCLGSIFIFRGFLIK